MNRGGKELQEQTKRKGEAVAGGEKKDPFMK